MIGLGLSVVQVAVRQLLGRTFNPLQLFANNEQGIWLDPSDPTTMFEDLAGTVPAVLESPVARINDKSGRGNHATQATATSRPILRQDASGRYYLFFDGIDDWMETSSSVQVIPLNSSFTAFIGARKANTSPNAFGSIGTSARLHVLQEAFESGTTFIYTNGSDVSINARVANQPEDTLVATYIATIGQFIQYRRNGVSITVTQSSGLVARTGSGGLYIGRRETSSRFNGRIYSMIIPAAASTADQITQTETWVNSKTGAY